MIQKNADGPVPDECEAQGSGETLAESSPEATATDDLASDRGVRASSDLDAEREGDDDGTAADGQRLADEGEPTDDARAPEARDVDDAQALAAQDDECAGDDGDDLGGGEADSAELPADGVDDELAAAVSEPEGADEPSAPPCDRPLGQRIEAVLFASGQPLPPAKLARVLSVPLEEVKTALDELVVAWQGREGAIDLVAIAGGYRFMTRPAFQADLQGLARKGKTERLSPAALETLSIVAYKQPITRADIEAVRGVAAGPLLRVLLDRDLIRVSGRSPEPGHPLLYGTTKRFLDHFGLESLRQLPDIRDLLDVS